MTVTCPPLVSIGLPVRNGATYLAEAVESILAQTYRNLELIICDNASSDATAELCAAFALLDPRVLYIRNDHDLGGAANHNRTVELARGRYFRWAAHDDLVEPTLVERCVEVLESDPGAVLCHTDVVHIDARGVELDLVSRNHGADADPVRRFAEVIEARDFCEETYAVVRTDVFRATGLQREYTGSDRTLMGELALRGRFATVSQPLFRKRLHPANEYVDWRTRMVWFGEHYRGRVALPFWMQWRHLLDVVGRVPLSSGDRRRALGVVARWGWSHRRNLAKDVAVAASSGVRSRTARVRRSQLTENWA